MFFMVLDLRLTKVGTRRSPFFCIYTYRQTVGTYRSVLLLIYSFAVFSKHNPNIFLLLKNLYCIRLLIANFFLTLYHA